MRRLIKTDGTTQDFDKPQTLEQIRALIGASTLDTVNLRHMGHPLHVMAVDDRGFESKAVVDGNVTTLVPTRARKPLNQEATRLYHKNCIPGVTHQIVGDVFISPDEDFA